MPGPFDAPKPKDNSDSENSFKLNLLNVMSDYISDSSTQTTAAQAGVEQQPLSDDGDHLYISFDEFGPAFNRPTSEKETPPTEAGKVPGEKSPADKSVPPAGPGGLGPKDQVGLQKPEAAKDVPGKKNDSAGASTGQTEKINFTEVAKKLGLQENASQKEINLAIKKQIELLGNDEYQIRETAQALLKSLGPAAVRELAKAHAQTDDLEVRRRTQRLIQSNLGNVPAQSSQLRDNLKHLETLDGDERKAFMEKMLKDPTYHPTPKDFERSRLVKSELEQAERELDPKRRDKLTPFLNHVEDSMSLEKIHTRAAVPRIIHARDIATQRPEEALHQLNLAIRDNFQRSNDHSVFFDAAVDALKTLGFNNPKSQAWLKTAKEKGIDMKYLEQRGGPKAK